MKLPRQTEHVVRVRLPFELPLGEIGLGDVIKRATSKVGIKPCTPCEQRAMALNRRIVFTGRRSASRPQH
jgi:hypothetical protein